MKSNWLAAPADRLPVLAYHLMCLHAQTILCFIAALVNFDVAYNNNPNAFDNPYDVHESVKLSLIQSSVQVFAKRFLWGRRMCVRARARVHPLNSQRAAITILQAL